MHFRLGRSRGSPREEDTTSTASGVHLPPSAVQYDMTKPTHGQVDFERVKTSSPGRNNREEKDHPKSTTVQAPQFLPALDPLSDPSSDEYESSPEHQHRAAGHQQHRSHPHKLAVSPHQLLSAALHIKHSSSPSSPTTESPARAKSPRVGGIFHRHHHGGSGGKSSSRRQQQQQSKSRDADSVARGVARGAAQAHADSFKSDKTNSQQQQQDNGFLNILLGEHAQVMEQLHEKAPSDPAVYRANASTPTKAAKNTAGGAESKAQTPPMSSLQRRLAQMKAPATPTKGQGNGVSKASTTPPPTSTAIATTLSPASPSSNHRHRTQWSPSSKFDDEDDEGDDDDDDEEEEALSTTILPYYEACDEVVNRLGIGSRPPRHTAATHTSPDASPARSTFSTTATSRSPARRIGASAATYPRDGDGDGEEDVDSPVKLARIMASGAIPYHPATSSSASTGTSTGAVTESPVKLARIMGCGAIPTIPEEDGDETEEAGEMIKGDEPDTAVRRLTFDLPEDMACGGDKIADEAAALDLADAGGKAGQMVGGRDDGTVSLLTAGSALSSYRRATERAAAAQAAEARESSPPPPPAPKKSSLQRALVAQTSAKPSSLQLALAASASTKADLPLLVDAQSVQRNQISIAWRGCHGAWGRQGGERRHIGLSPPRRHCHCSCGRACRPARPRRCRHRSRQACRGGG